MGSIRYPNMSYSNLWFRGFFMAWPWAIPMFSLASPGSPTITPPISSKVVHLPWANGMPTAWSSSDSHYNFLAVSEHGETYNSWQFSWQNMAKVHHNPLDFGPKRTPVFFDVYLSSTGGIRLNMDWLADESSHRNHDGFDMFWPSNINYGRLMSMFNLNY